MRQQAVYGFAGESVPPRETPYMIIEISRSGSTKTA